MTEKQELINLKNNKYRNLSQLGLTYKPTHELLINDKWYKAVFCYERCNQVTFIIVKNRPKNVDLGNHTTFDVNDNLNKIVRIYKSKSTRKRKTISEVSREAIDHAMAVISSKKSDYAYELFNDAVRDVPRETKIGALRYLYDHNRYKFDELVTEVGKLR
jgi:hypothetical protein